MHDGQLQPGDGLRLHEQHGGGANLWCQPDDEHRHRRHIHQPDQSGLAREARRRDDGVARSRDLVLGELASPALPGDCGEALLLPGAGQAQFVVPGPARGGDIRAGGERTHPAERQPDEQRRTERFQRAEKQAMEAPVKLIGPLMMFIFPVTFIVLFFPIVSKFMSSGLL